MQTESDAQLEAERERVRACHRLIDREVLNPALPRLVDVDYARTQG